MSRKSTSLATGFLSGLADEIKEKNKTKRELAQAMLMQQLQGQAAMEREQMAQDAAMQRQKSQLESEQVFQTGRGERQQQFDLEKLLLAKQLESSIPKALNPEEQAQAGSLQLIDRMTKLPLTRAYGQESMLAPFTPARGAIPAMEEEAFGKRTGLLQQAGLVKSTKSPEELMLEAFMRTKGNEQAREQYGAQTKRPVPQGLQSTISDTVNALERMKEFRITVEDNPDIQTGPAELRFKRGGVGGFIGNLGLQYGTDKEKSKRITEMAKKANQLQDIYRRAVTGAQAGFPEIRFLQSSIPSPEIETRENMLTSLNVTQSELEKKLDQMIGVLDAAGYDTNEFIERFGLGSKRAEKLVSGKMRVRRKSDGKSGTINSADFDSAKYEKI